MKRWRILRRARLACARAADLYDLARFLAGRGDFCGAGRLRQIAECRAGAALDALALAEPYLPQG